MPLTMGLNVVDLFATLKEQRLAFLRNVGHERKVLFAMLDARGLALGLLCPRP